MITVNRANLVRATEWAARGLSNQTPTVTMETLGGSLAVWTSNYDVEVRATIPCEGETPPVNLPGAVLASVVKTMRGEEAKIERDGSKVTVTAGSRATFGVSEQGPISWGSGIGTTLTTVDAGELRRCLTWASIGAQKDDKGAAWLQGVRILGRDGTLEFRGGNTFSAGRVVIQSDDAIDLAVPAALFANLSRAFTGSVSLSERNGSLVASDGMLSATLRTMTDPGWPDVEKIWNPPQPCSVVLNRDDLLSALASVTAGGDVVVLAVNPDHMAVSSSHGLDWDKDETTSVSDTVPITESEGEPQWRFQEKFLVPALKELRGEQIRLAGKSGAFAVMLSDWPAQGTFRTIMSMRGRA